MNPWDLSCRSKLGQSQHEQQHQQQQPVSLTITNTAEQLYHRPSNVTVANLELRNGPATGLYYKHLPTTAAGTLSAVHLAAYSTAAATLVNFSQSSTITTSLCIKPSTSSLSSSFSSPSFSPPSSLPTISLPHSVTSSLTTTPASSRSNSIEISDDIKLAQRVALFNEQASSPQVASETSNQQTSDRLHNSSESTINSTDTISSSSSTSSGGSSSSVNSNSSCSGGGSLLLQDRKARKKDQNRRAAYNYRRKKMEEKNRMREEEMRLVYSRVCLIGYVEKLEGSIMYILNTKTRKILDKDGKSICFLCPICLQSCDNILNLRSHLNEVHFENSDVVISNNKSC